MQTAKAKMRENSPLRTLIVWSVITVLAIFGIFAPSIFGMDGFSGGFAISTLSFLLVLAGIIVIVIYAGRAKTVAKILNSENLLAHWKYKPEHWNQYAKAEYKTEKRGKWRLFYIVAAWALFFGIIALIINFENGIWVMGLMLALIVIIAFTAWFTSWNNYRQNIKYLGETYITADAVYINRQLHTWNGLGANLDTVYLSKEGKIPILAFTYSAPTRTGIEEYTVRVPVPPGHEKDMEKIMDYFNGLVSLAP